MVDPPPVPAGRRVLPPPPPAPPPPTPHVRARVGPAWGQHLPGTGLSASAVQGVMSPLKHSLGGYHCGLAVDPPPARGHRRTVGEPPPTCDRSGTEPVRRTAGQPRHLGSRVWRRSSGPGPRSSALIERPRWRKLVAYLFSPACVICHRRPPSRRRRLDGTVNFLRGPGTDHGFARPKGLG